MKNKSVYCTNCGSKNSNTAEVCKNCGEKLAVKDHLFREFLYHHTKEELKKEITDNIFSLISRFLISHLYGVFFAATIIFTGVAATSYVINVNSKSYTKVKEVPVVATTCHKVNSVKPVMACAKGYELIDEKCQKEATVNAKATKTCSDGYTLNGSNCLSNTTYNKVATKECILPQNLKDQDFSKGSLNEEGKCSTYACAKYRDGECVDIVMEEYEPTTVTSCPSGTKEVSGKCYKTSTVKTTYSCENGKLANNMCLIMVENEPTPSCEDGYVYNEECNVCEAE